MISKVSSVNHHPTVIQFSTGLSLTIDDSRVLTCKKEEVIIGSYSLSSLIKFTPGYWKIFRRSVGVGN
jgi:hypothetical protein